LKLRAQHKSRGWLKPSEASQYSGVSLKVFRSWLKAGLKHSRLPNRRILVSISAIDEFLNSFEVQSTTSQAATELLEGLAE
jgi:predicted site-specific integrase-resolvase